MIYPRINTNRRHELTIRRARDGQRASSLRQKLSSTFLFVFISRSPIRDYSWTKALSLNHTSLRANPVPAEATPAPEAFAPGWVLLFSTHRFTQSNGPREGQNTTFPKKLRFQNVSFQYRGGKKNKIARSAKNGRVRRVNAGTGSTRRGICGSLRTTATRPPAYAVEVNERRIPSQFLNRFPERCKVADVSAAGSESFNCLPRPLVGPAFGAS
jgi:hypothetical protein